jgi:DnaD/phage-associated family protein
VSLKLSSELWASVFAVPSQIVDKHIKLCGGVSLKVLLLVLRHPDRAASVKTLSRQLNLSSADVADALNYWMESGVLTEDFSEDTAADEPEREEPEAPAAPVQTPVPEAPVKKAPYSSSRPRYPRDETLTLIEKDAMLSSLLDEAQTVLAKTFTSADMDVLVALYSFYGLSPHYILTLLHYCATIQKRSMGYAESVAASWIQEGVDENSVDAHVERQLRRRSMEGKIRSAFGITDRRLVPKEREMITRWTDELGYDLDMINKAYEICAERTGKLAFSYINKISSAGTSRALKPHSRRRGKTKNERQRHAERAVAGQHHRPFYEGVDKRHGISRRNCRTKPRNPDQAPRKGRTELLIKRAQIAERAPRRLNGSGKSLPHPRFWPRRCFQRRTSPRRSRKSAF